MNGTPLAGLWADAVAGVCVAAAVAAPAATHAARLDPAAPTLVADADQASLTPTRLTAAARLVAERHVAASRAAAAARDVAEAAAAAAAYAGSHRAAAAAAALKDAVAALRRADAWLADAAAAVSAAPFDAKDPALVAAALAVARAAWGGPPPRAPSRDDVDAASDAVWSAASPALRRFLVDVVMRAAVADAAPRIPGRDRPDARLGANRGFVASARHPEPPGAISVAVCALDAAARAVVSSDAAGTTPETLAIVVPSLAAATCDVVAPPPPPPDPRRAAPPEMRTVAAPTVRIAAYRFVSAVVDARPSVTRAHLRRDAEDPIPSGDYLRAPEGPPARVADAAATIVVDVAVKCAVAEVAAAAGYAGAKAAEEEAKRGGGGVGGDGGGGEGGGVEDVPKNVPFSDVPKNVPKNASSSSSSLYSSADADATRRALRLLLGAHPNAGAMDEVSRRFESPTNPRRAHPRYSRESRVAAVGAAGKGTLDLARDCSVGRDVDAAVAGLEFMATVARASPEGASTIAATLAVVAAALREPASDANAKRACAPAANAVWAAVREAAETNTRANGVPIVVPPPPPPPPPDVGYRAGAGIGAAAPGLTGLTVVAPPPPKTPWPADAPLHVSFARIATASDTSTSVSVIGAVVRREPPSGTKSLKNPKTGRSYDMLFVTLADHTGARCRAQLIGKKARAAAATLEQAAGGAGGIGEERRVVVGVCGVIPQRRATNTQTGAAVAAVWDPKETCVLVVNPEHAAAKKL